VFGGARRLDRLEVKPGLTARGVPATVSCMRIDHVVVWVEDPLQALSFYCDVLGLPGVRVEEFRAGTAPFPSVRVCEDSILDLMPRVGAPFVNELTQVAGSAGHPLNHVCFALSGPELAALRGRLDAAGVPIAGETPRSFGALGYARAFYFRDPDGNVLEARSYEG